MTNAIAQSIDYWCRVKQTMNDKQVSMGIVQSMNTHYEYA